MPLGAKLKIFGTARGDLKAAKSGDPSRYKQKAQHKPTPAGETRAPEDGLAVGTVFRCEGQNCIATGRERNEDAPARFVSELHDVEIDGGQRV